MGIGRFLLFVLKGFYFSFSILLAPILSAESEETTEHENLGGAVANGLSTDAFFRLFETPELKSARAACMGGERFTQSYSGKSHQRSVGRMSNGYFYGMMMSFARNACSSKSGALNEKLKKQAGASGQLDALNHYGPKGDPLIQNYSLLLPLGMIESSGMYNEGRDKSASNVSAMTAEAGLFQVSYNSTNLGSGSMKQVYQELLSDYKISSESDLTSNSACMTGVFGLNQRTSKNAESYGGGAGLLFQKVMKACPALAADYMAALLRTNKNHNGPLNRKEAQPREACVQVMTTFKEYLAKDKNCDAVEGLAAQFPNDPRAKEAFAVASPLDRGEVGTGRSRASLYDGAAESRAQAEDMEAEQQALLKSGQAEEAAKLNQQIADLKKNAEMTENDIDAVISKIAQVTAEIPKIEEQIKQSETNEKVYREEAAGLRRQAASEKDPVKKAELEKKAEEKDRLAKEYKDNAERLRKELEAKKKEIEDLKKKEEELKKKKTAQIETIKIRIKTLDDQIKELRAELANAGMKTPELETELKAKEDEMAKLKEELARLEKP